MLLSIAQGHAVATAAILRATRGACLLDGVSTHEAYRLPLLSRDSSPARDLSPRQDPPLASRATLAAERAYHAELAAAEHAERDAEHDAERDAEMRAERDAEHAYLQAVCDGEIAVDVDDDEEVSP